MLRGLGVLLLAVLVNLPLAGEWWSDHELNQHGVVVAGRIRHLDPEHRLVEYTLPPRYGQHALFQARLTPAGYDDAARRHRLPVRVVPQSPRRNQPVGLDSTAFLPVVTVLGDLILLVGLALWLRAIRRTLRLVAETPVSPLEGCVPGISELPDGRLRVVGRLVDARRGTALLEVGDGRRVRVETGPLANQAALRELAQVTGRRVGNRVLQDRA